MSGNYADAMTVMLLHLVHFNWIMTIPWHMPTHHKLSSSLICLTRAPLSQEEMNPGQNQAIVSLSQFPRRKVCYHKNTKHHV
jgi:hypothetical protein